MKKYNFKIDLLETSSILNIFKWIKQLCEKTILQGNNFIGNNFIQLTILDKVIINLLKVIISLIDRFQENINIGSVTGCYYDDGEDKLDLQKR